MEEPQRELAEVEGRTTQEMIQFQAQKEQIKDLSTVEAMEKGLGAKPHTPVYMMHRYFARRPHNVFNYLVRHYSNPGDIVLDPFCGGGVTVVEALRLRRKVIGIDFNPMATFITKMEAVDVNLGSLRETFTKLERKLKEAICELYETKCPRCGRKTSAKWLEWSLVLKCQHCSCSIVVAKARKIGPGQYKCAGCGGKVKSTKCEREKDAIIRLKLKCSCRFNGTKEPDERDNKKVRDIEGEFETLIKKKGLWYPQNEMPQDFDLRRPYNRMYMRFCDFFTQRNLLALCMIFKEIERIEDRKIRELLEFTFTAGLFEASILTHIKHGTIVKPGSHYWVSDVRGEKNVWDNFMSKFQDVVTGKLYSRREIGRFYREAKSFKDLSSGKTCLILTQSSTDLSQFQDDSVDSIITDPPYGGNVMYSEICNFWSVWLKDTLDIDSLINDKQEAIKNRRQGKGDNEYEELLYQALKECYRVLKPGHWLVMTFHNKEFAVWRSLLRACTRAGFYLPRNGVVYQKPIEAYVTTIHQRRGGAVLGDFIYSFKKSEATNTWKRFMGGVDELVAGTASEIIQKKGSATTSEVFEKIIPVLIHSDALDQEQVVRQNVENILKARFTFEDGAWILTETKEDVRMRIERIVSDFLAKNEPATFDQIDTEVKAKLTQYSLTRRNGLKSLIDMKDVELEPILRESFVWTEDRRWRRPTAEEREQLDGTKIRKVATFLNKLERKESVEPLDNDLLIFGMRYCIKSKEPAKALTLYKFIDSKKLTDEQGNLVESLKEMCME